MNPTNLYPDAVVTLVLCALAAAGAVAAVLLWRHTARLRHQVVALRHAAHHDRLTGLRNRAGLAEAWADTAEDPAVGLLLVDLDGFKPVNDEYGHAAGDQVLTEVARRLRIYAPEGVPARLGGDEFAVIVTSGDPCRLARRLEAVLSEPYDLDEGPQVEVTASIGAAAVPGVELATGLACADAAMYRAKTTGCGVAAYDPFRDDRTSPAGDPRPVSRVRGLPRQRHGWGVAA